MKMKAKDQLSDVISKTINRFRKDKKPLAPTVIAESVYQKLDPNADAPFLVRFTSQCDIQERSRSQLRALFGREEQLNANRSGAGRQFSLLQDFYPTGREEGVYLPRMELSYEQRMDNVDRLASTGEGFTAHADELRAETEMLVAQGNLKKPKTYRQAPITTAAPAHA